jgi:hypothetical protein
MRARAAIRLLLVSVTVFAATAQAHGSIGLAGAALKRQARILAAEQSPASCPAGVPVQTITVVNQANVRPWALARVENAVVAQSLQLRTAWGTPCVQFDTGGWPLYLRVGGTEWGVHNGYPTISIQVYTDGLPYRAWSQVFSHEVVETLVDPDGSGALGQPGGVDYFTDGTARPLEVADPVEERGYALDGVYVADFESPRGMPGRCCMTRRRQTWVSPARRAAGNAFSTDPRSHPPTLPARTTR